MTRSNRYGRPGPDGPATEALRQWWEGAARRNAEHPGPGEWVPVEAIQVDLSILPRTRVDEDTVQRYRDAFLDLPPIVVQRDTFTLIGGLHRLSAAQGVSDYCRIVEKDIADADLEDAALEDNRLHGLPLGAAERKHAAEKLYRRHHPDTGGTRGTAWTVDRLALFAGVGHDLIDRWLRRDRAAAVGLNQANSPVESAGAESEAIDPATGEIVTMAAPEPVSAPMVTARLGVDGRAYPVRPASGGAAKGKAAKPITYTSVGDVPPVAGAPGAYARLIAVMERVAESNAAMLEMSPAHGVDEIPTDTLAEQGALAERMVAWWGRRQDAIELRLSEIAVPAAGES